LDQEDKILNTLKKNGQIDNGAAIIKSESYVFEQAHLNQSVLKQVKPGNIFEVLNTSHIANIGQYVDKWSSGMKPWNETMQDHFSR
jgi:hypothetical protein